MGGTMNYTTNATLKSNLVWVLRGAVIAGGLSLAACAPMSLPGESGAQPAANNVAQEVVSVVEPTSTDATPETSLTPESTNTAGLPNPTSTPLPFETATAVAGQSVEFIGTIESFDNGVLVVSGRSVIITAQTEIKFQPQKGLNVKVEGTLQGDGSVLAREIKSVPDGLATHKPDVTRTSRPEGTPEPRGTQQANEVEFRGTVSAINGNVYVVDGITVVATGEIKGTIAVGDTVKVHGVKQADGTVWAREIELAGGDDGHDGRGGDDDHGTSTPAPTAVGSDDHGGSGGGHGSDDGSGDDHGGSGGGNDNGGGHGGDDGGDDHGGGHGGDD